MNQRERITIDGVEVHIASVGIGRAYVDTVVYTKNRFGTRQDLTVRVVGRGSLSVLHFFARPRARVSNVVLAKRVAYGGRKGRAARRRLLRGGFDGVLTVWGGREFPSPPFRLVGRKGRWR